MDLKNNRRVTGSSPVGGAERRNAKHEARIHQVNSGLIFYGLMVGRARGAAENQECVVFGAACEGPWWSSASERRCCGRRPGVLWVGRGAWGFFHRAADLLGGHRRRGCRSLPTYSRVQFDARAPQWISGIDLEMAPSKRRGYHGELFSRGGFHAERMPPRTRSSFRRGRRRGHAGVGTVRPGLGDPSGKSVEAGTGRFFHER